jgi:hypothetical protein
MGLKRPSEDGEYFDGTLFLESPLEPAVLEQCLARQHLEGHDSIREFCTCFPGIRQRPRHSGNFERPEEWEAFRALQWEEDAFEPGCQPMIREWFDALILYTTSTGDMVLLNADGRTAWILHEEHRITPLAPSFSDFLDLCAESYERHWCLDYYRELFESHE